MSETLLALKEMGKTLKTVCVERDALKSSVSGLLATIHQDGGQFEQEYGTDVAIKNAAVIYTALNAYNDALIIKNEAQAGALSAHMQKDCNCAYCQDARTALK